MWKLFSKLFGCEYVHVNHNIYDGAVRRVQIAPNGTRCVKLQSGRKAFILEPLPLTGGDFGGWRITPLTKGITEQKREK